MSEKTSSQLKKAINAAEKIAAMAEDSLRGLDLAISSWPAEFRAIVWDAVAALASRRAEAAKKDEP